MGSAKCLTTTPVHRSRGSPSLPSNLTTNTLPQVGNSFDLVPPGQLGIIEDQLIPQEIRGGRNVTTDINKLNGTVVNGGTATNGEGWSQTPQGELANRYTAASLLSWYATGGSLQNLPPRKPMSSST